MEEATRDQGSGKKVSSESESCMVRLEIDEKGWRLKPEPGSRCEKELSSLPKLPPAVQKYLEKHLQEG